MATHGSAQKFRVAEPFAKTCSATMACGHDPPVSANQTQASLSEILTVAGRSRTAVRDHARATALPPVGPAPSIAESTYGCDRKNVISYRRWIDTAGLHSAKGKVMPEREIARAIDLCAQRSTLLAETIALIRAAKAQIVRSKKIIGSAGALSYQSLFVAPPTRSEKTEFLAGEHAPETGDYVELNVFGTRTARAQWLVRGQPFPTTPICYSWRRAPVSSPSDRPTERPENRAPQLERV